jgi:hypothetical protein
MITAQTFVRTEFTAFHPVCQSSERGASRPCAARRKAKEDAAQDPVIASVMGCVNSLHVLSSGLAAVPANSNGAKAKDLVTKPADRLHAFGGR